MIENRFFTWVWRFNALAIALLVLFVLAMILWDWTRDWRRDRFPTQTTEVLNVEPVDQSTDAPAPTVAETVRFGSPADGAAAGLYVLPQYVAQTYQNSGISKESGGNRVNYLIVDTNDQSKRWLFEPGPRLITDVRALWHNSANNRRVFLGHVLHVIDADNTADGRLSRSDKGTLLFVTPDWAEPVALVESMTSILDVRVISPTTIDVIYRNDTQTTLRRFALPDAQLDFELDLTNTP